MVEPAYRGRLIGVESEYFVVDRETLELRDCLAVLERHSQFGARVKPEIVRQQIEICSNAFESIAELEEQLRDDLSEVIELLDEAGAMLLPISLLEKRDFTWTDNPRVRLLHHHLGRAFEAAAGTITADQINVGANDEADAFVIFRKLLGILPEIVGLSAASPFRRGVPNGVVCNRMDAYDEALSAVPAMGGIPPPLTTMAEYNRYIASQPVFREPGTCYAYLRPMPHRGVAAEIRCIDKQRSLEDTLAFAALAKAVMWSTGELLPAVPNDGEMRAWRRSGAVDKVRCAALLAHLEQFLPDEETHYLNRMFAKLETGSTAEGLIAGHRRLGYGELLRLLATEARLEILSPRRR